MTSLTKQQQELVAQNLLVVHWVICDYIHVNPTICGLEYSDLFQEGCVWLCKAAATYESAKPQPPMRTMGGRSLPLTPKRS